MFSKFPYPQPNAYFSLAAYNDRERQAKYALLDNGEYAMYTELNHGEPYPGRYAMDAVRLGIAISIFETEEEAIAAAEAFAAEVEAEKAVAVPPPSS